jgi:hypothetical protein
MHTTILVANSGRDSLRRTICPRNAPVDDGIETLSIKRMSGGSTHMLEVSHAIQLFKCREGSAYEVFRVRGKRVLLGRDHEQSARGDATKQIIEIEVIAEAGNDERHLQGGLRPQFVSKRAH